MKITHQIDRGGRTGIIKGRLESVAMHGPSGPGGDGLALGFPPIVYDSAGLMKAADGTSDYTATVAVPGVNTTPPDMTLTITYGGKEVFQRTFSPVLKTPTDDHLDLNEVFARGGDVAVTPTQLLALGTGLALLDAKSARADTDHAATVQSLADSAQKTAQIAALLGATVVANPSAIPNVAGRYLTTDPGYAMQVYEKVLNTAPTRRSDLEASPRTALPAERVSSVDALRLRVNNGAPVQTLGYAGPLTRGGATYDPDPSDTTSADNGGSILVGTDGTRYHLREKIITPWYYGASGGRLVDDRSAVQKAIDGVLADGYNYLDLSSSKGFIISEALYIPKGIVIDFAASGSIIEQTTWGKPHFYIESANDVHLRGIAQLVYLGTRTNIKSADAPTSADPRLHANYQAINAGIDASNPNKNTRNLAAGVYLRHKCDRFTADHLYVKGQVIGMSHNTFGNDDIYYSDDNQVGLLHVEGVDFGYLSGGFRRFKVVTVKAKNIVTTQGDPSHAVYVGPRTVPNTSLEIGSIDMDGGALVVDADDTLGASDAFSIRATDQVHVGNVKTRNTQYLGNVQSGKIQIDSINAILLPLLSGVQTNSIAVPFAAQANALVTIGESRIESALGWSAGRQDASLFSVSSGAELRVRESYTRMTAPSPARVATLQSSGALMEFHRPEVRYDNPFDAAYANPAAFTSFAPTGTGKFRMDAPQLTGTDRLFTAAAGIDWRIRLDPTRIANNTLNTIIGVTNDYRIVFTGQHDTPPVEPATTGTYGITLRSRNSMTINNTAGATIAGFSGGTTGQTYTLYCNDNFTVIENNASVVLKGAANLLAGTWKWFKFVMVAGVAYEITNGGADAGATSKTAIGNLTRANLASRGQLSGPQFADGHRWVWSTTGTANGGTAYGTKVEAAGGGVWVRQTTEKPNVKWWGVVDDGVTDNKAALTTAIAAVGYSGELYFPPSTSYYAISAGLIIPYYFKLSGAGRYQSRIRLLATTGDFIQVRSDGAVQFEDLGFYAPSGQVMAEGSKLISIRGSGPGLSNASSRFSRCTSVSMWCSVDVIAGSGYVFLDCNFNDLQERGVSIRLRNIWNPDSGDGVLDNVIFHANTAVTANRGVLYQSGGGLRVINSKFYPHKTAAFHLNVLPGVNSGIHFISQCSFEAQAKVAQQLDWGTADPVWVRGGTYALNDRVQPDVKNGYIYIVTTAGTAGSTYPAWGTAVDGSTTDGGVTWQALPMEPTDRKNNTAYAVGDYMKRPYYPQYIYRATVAGTSGASEPAWPTTITNGDTLTDGGVTWLIIRMTAPPRWKASTLYQEGQTVRPGTANGYIYVAGITANVGDTATSGAVEPTWPTGFKATVTDGGITWVAINDSQNWVKGNITNNQFSLDGQANIRYDGGGIVKNPMITANQHTIGATTICVDLLSGVGPEVFGNQFIRGANDFVSGGTGIHIGTGVLYEKIGVNDFSFVQYPVVDDKGTCANHHKTLPLNTAAGWAPVASKTPQFIRQPLNGVDKITLSGQALNPSASSANPANGNLAGIIATLPVGFRPAATVNVVTIALTPANLYSAFIEIRSDGTIRLTAQVGASSTAAVSFISLDGITFTVAPLY